MGLIPQKTWNILQCKEFALETIELMMQNKKFDNIQPYDYFFKGFAQFKSLNAGVIIGSFLATYANCCVGAGIPQRIWGIALRESMEDQKDNIHKWYQTRLYE